MLLINLFVCLFVCFQADALRERFEVNRKVVCFYFPSSYPFYATFHFSDKDYMVLA